MILRWESGGYSLGPRGGEMVVSTEDRHLKRLRWTTLIAAFLPFFGTRAVSTIGVVVIQTFGPSWSDKAKSAILILVPFLVFSVFSVVTAWRSFILAQELQRSRWGWSVFSFLLFGIPAGILSRLPSLAPIRTPEVVLAKPRKVGGTHAVRRPTRAKTSRAKPKRRRAGPAASPASASSAKGGSRLCPRCDATLKWWSARTIARFGFEKVSYQGQGAPGIPADCVGVCTDCRDGYCKAHAPEGLCPQCSATLTC